MCVYIFADEVILSTKITWGNFLIYIDHPKLPNGEPRSLSPFMTSLVGTTCAAQTNFLLQSIPEWDFFSNAWKKFKNFHFQIRNSVQFLYWKRRFHDLVIWFFKSLTFCFCLNCNQKTALVYVSKGVRFLKKIPGTNGLTLNSFGSGNMLKKNLCRVYDGYLFLLFLSTFTPNHWQWKIYFCCCCFFF